MTKLEGKTWEELVLTVYKDCVKKNEQIDLFVQKIEGFSLDLDDLERYISALKKKISIPKWTRLMDANPSDLDIHAIKYLIFIEPDFLLEALWREIDKKFLVQDYDDNRIWSEETPMYWLPITYPTPY